MNQFQEFHDKLQKETREEQSPDLASDSIDLKLVCALDEKFSGQYHGFQMDSMKKVCGAIRAAAGRTIKDVVYEPHPLDIALNPQGTIGSFKLILEPLSE